jgi:hypothetical protein
MAVFMDTGGGDIYGGPTKEAVIAAMKADSDEHDFEKDAFEVSGSTKVGEVDENEMPTGNLVTLAKVFGNGADAYMIASENC